MPVAYNSSYRNIIFEMYCFHFGAAVVKIFNTYKKIYPAKKILVTVSLFSQPRFPEKKSFKKIELVM